MLTMHPIGYTGSFTGYGRGWRGKVEKVTCSLCSGSGGGRGELCCGRCNGLGVMWQLKANFSPQSPAGNQS